MTSKRNENRQTKVNFMFWNPEIGGTPYEKSEKIPYTRSTEIARKTLVEMFPNCMVQVIEPLIQEEIKRTVFNPQLVFENMLEDYENEESANGNYNPELETVVPYTMYEYSGHFWAIDSEGNYLTDYIFDTSPMKLGKVDGRAFVKMTAEKAFNCKVLAIHGDERIQVTRYAIVSNEDLSKCVKEA